MRTARKILAFVVLMAALIPWGLMTFLLMEIHHWIHPDGC